MSGTAFGFVAIGIGEGIHEEVEDLADLLLVAEFPGTEAAMKASATLSKLLGISFTTSPAVSGEDFDKIMGKA